jgi:hypothetical protein
MTKKQLVIEGLYNELIHLCEVRGELDDASNAKIEKKIAEIQKQINELEAV